VLFFIAGYFFNYLKTFSTTSRHNVRTLAQAIGGQIKTLTGGDGTPGGLSDQVAHPTELESASLTRDFHCSWKKRGKVF